MTMLDRRAFLGTLGLLAAPLAAEAQPAGKVARIGILSPSMAGPSPLLAAATSDTSKTRTSLWSIDSPRREWNGSRP